MLLCLCGILAVEKLGLQSYDVSEVMILLMEWNLIVELLQELCGIL